MSRLALATPIIDFQRQHRRNVETGCRGGTEGGEVTAEECCIAPRCRIEPFLDQGGSAALRRGPAPRRALPWEARPAHAGPTRADGPISHLIVSTPQDAMLRIAPGDPWPQAIGTP